MMKKSNKKFEGINTSQKASKVDKNKKIRIKHQKNIKEHIQFDADLRTFVERLILSKEEPIEILLKNITENEMRENLNRELNKYLTADSANTAEPRIRGLNELTKIIKQKK